MSATGKKIQYSAIFGAFVASAFIASEIAIILFEIVYLSLGGIVQYVAYGICTLLLGSFWLWFYRHAYKVELALLLENEAPDPS